MRPPLRLMTDQEETMSKTSSRNSPGTVIALAAGGVALALVSGALAQGIQPPAVQAGPGAGPHTGGTLLPGNTKIPGAGGAVDTFNKGTGAGGAVDTFNKGTTGAAGFIWFNKGGPGAAGAVDAFNKGNKAAGAEPPPSPAKGVGTSNPGAAASPRDAASVPVGPRAAGYLKSPIKGDPKAKLGDKVIGEDGARTCATGKVC
jgi:hypothetical protein